MRSKLKNIDLHIHTIHSDGQHTVSEILRQCEKIGLSSISITDHDSVNAYDELNDSEIRNLFSGIIIPGIELSFDFGGRLFDVLGYDIDTSYMKSLLNERMNENRKKEMQSELLEECKRICIIKGIKFDEKLSVKNGTKSEAFNLLFTDISDFNKYPQNKRFAKYIFRDNRADFYKKCFSNPNSEFFVNEAKYSPTLKEAIDIIHKCGGKAFLAHSFAYGLENPIEFINYAIECGIDGIEKYYTSFTQEQSDLIGEISNTNNLYVSGGSDFHGLVIKKQFILGKPAIDKSIIFPWANKYFKSINGGNDK